MLYEHGQAQSASLESVPSPGQYSSMKLERIIRQIMISITFPIQSIDTVHPEMHIHCGLLVPYLVHVIILP